MILYLDRSWSAMIYSMDRSWQIHGVNIYRIVLILVKKSIHNLAHLLYSNGNKSCFGHPSCDLSQDRPLSGLRHLSWSILASDPTWDVHTKICYLNVHMGLMFGAGRDRRKLWNFNFLSTDFEHGRLAHGRNGNTFVWSYHIVLLEVITLYVFKKNEKQL